MSPEFITVDDRDPSVIYTGDSAAWNLGGVYPEYDNTTHGASSSATPGQIHFSFQGIRVTVYGTIGPAATSLVSMYSLDGSPASTYTAMSTQVTLYRQQYFDSGVLEDGQHELAISVLSGQNATVWFDFFQYLPSSASSRSESSTTTGTRSSSAARSISIITKAPAGSSTPLDDSSKESTAVPVGVVVGGVIGGIFLIATIAFISFLIYRRKTRSSFPPRNLSQTSQVYVERRGDPFLSSGRQAASSMSYRRPSIAETRIHTPDPHLHEDAGLRLDGGHDQRIDLPPHYQTYMD